MAIESNGPAPYAPIGAVVGTIEGYRDRGLTVPFTTDVLVRAGVAETLAPRTLQALKILDLAHDDGRPTDTLEALRTARGEEEYKARLGEWLNAAYADVLQFTDPATDSRDRVAEAFRGYTPAGQRGRMVNLMLGLFEHAGLIEPQKNLAPARAPKPAARRATPDRSEKRTAQSSKRQPDQQETPDGIPPALVGLLKQAPWGTGWSKERRDQFLRAFTVVLDFSVPITDYDPFALSDEEEGDS